MATTVSRVQAQEPFDRAPFIFERKRIDDLATSPPKSSIRQQVEKKNFGIFTLTGIGSLKSPNSGPILPLSSVRFT